MHQALPPRKSSQNPTYARASIASNLRRKRLKVAALLVLGIGVIFLLRTLSWSSAERIPIGTPEVVIVTVLDPDLKPEYIAQIKENREDYATRHGKHKLPRQ